MIAGILFDKDGTILEYHSTMHHIYTDFFADIKERYALPDLLMEKLKMDLGYSSNHLDIDSIIQFASNPQIVDVLIDASIEYSRKNQWEFNYSKSDLLAIIEENSLKKEVPYTTLPDVEETLDYLKTNHYKLGIATADNYAATVNGLKEADILHHFDYLGTSDDDVEPKPETFLADMFCRQCHIDPSELLIVGDSETDMLFAENAGANFIGIDADHNENSTFSEKGYLSISSIYDIIHIHNL